MEEEKALRMQINAYPIKEAFIFTLVFTVSILLSFLLIEPYI